MAEGNIAVHAYGRNTGELRFYVYNTGGQTPITIYASSVLTTNTWMMFAATWNASKGTLYKNGSFVKASASGSGPYRVPNALYLGSDRGNSNRGLDGLIDHVVSYNRALTKEEIAWLYREPFAIFTGSVSPALVFALVLAVVNLTGTLASESEASGKIRIVKQLIGSATAQALLYAVTRISKKVLGFSAATSEVSPLLKAIRCVATSTNCITSIDGSLTLMAEVLFAGEINAATGLSGILSTLACWSPWTGGYLQVEREWLREALYGGMTANAFSFGTALTLGWFWLRAAGCSALYRGPSMEQIDFVNALAVTDRDAGLISQARYVPHEENKTYFYVIRRFNNCGYQERTLSAAVKVSLDTAGNLTKPQPNSAIHTEAQQEDGQKIQIVWFYSPLEQKSAPSLFKVYHDGGTGQIDYDNPIATIGYQGHKYYTHRTTALQEGRYLFGVRTESATGAENTSLARLGIQLRHDCPPTVHILSTGTI